MRAPILNFEELKKAKQTYSDLSFQGFLINVSNSLREGLITKEQKDELLESKGKE